MTQLFTYLTFNGNCREAMTFYRDCLGGELTLQPIGASPRCEKLPSAIKDSVLHAMLKSESMTIMGSDMAPDDGLIRGNSVSLMLDCSSENDLRTFYRKLAQGGRADHALELTFWGAIFGALTDRFGNHWLLHHQK